ncbi:MAG: hypothetical protein CSB24_04390 [Deltaproteobacteria bacterium]|nr:MAG: hypothetical protein CSB24_04390 [Deltaproteobacteria bacterium]
MKTPPFFTGSVILFWGLESGHILLAVLLAALLEYSRLIKEKWTLSQDDFVRVSDLTSVLFIAAIALILLNLEPLNFFRETAIWLPVILSPLAAAQLYSTNDKIIIGTRIGSGKKIKYQHQPMDFSLLYTVLTIFAAAAANSRSWLFFPGVALLLGWLMFYNRGRSFPPWLFALCLLLVSIGGYYSFIGFAKAREQIRLIGWEMVNNYYLNRYADPFNSSIACGRLGRLKLSGRIILRVSSPSGKPPQLLKEASYTRYYGNIWRNNDDFSAAILADETSWQLMPPPYPQVKELTVEQNLPKEKGLLARPAFSTRAASPNLFELEINQAGTLKALDCAPIVKSTFSYLPRLVSPMPGKLHLSVPKTEQAALEHLAEKIWQSKDSEQEKIKKLGDFFAGNFSYTLELQDKGANKTLLQHFLLKSRRGHCELFATATTLLLRTAGIPTRYVTGFAVDEFSSLENCYIVRNRHAHAWTEAFIGQHWITVDNTPPDWPNLDKKKRNLLEPLTDLAAYLKQIYKRFQINNEQKHTTLLSVIVVVLAALLSYSIYKRLQMQRNETGQQVRKKEFPVPESPFTELEQFLDKNFEPRADGETFTVWLERLASKHPVPHHQIIKGYRLHQKLRFDHISENEYGELEKIIYQIINEMLSKKSEEQTN